MSEIIAKLNEKERFQLYDLLKKEIFGYNLEDKIFELEGQVEELKNDNEQLRDIIEERAYRAM